MNRIRDWFSSRFITSKVVGADKYLSATSIVALESISLVEVLVYKSCTIGVVAGDVDDIVSANVCVGVFASITQ